MDYSLESDFVKQLDRDILEFVNRGLDNSDEERFNQLALREFELQYHVLLKDRTKIRSYSSGYYGYRHYPYGYGGTLGGVSSYDYKEGTLIIDVIDARTRRLAWRGWAVGATRKGYYTEEKVSEAVAAILKHFPPEMPKRDSRED